MADQARSKANVHVANTPAGLGKLFYAIGFTSYQNEYLNSLRQMPVHENEYVSRFVGHHIVSLLSQPGDDRLLLHDMATT